MGDALSPTVGVKNGAQTIWRRDRLVSPAQWRGAGQRSGVFTSETIAAGLVYGAVVFNFVLAFLNAHFSGLNRGTVILAEVLIVFMALVICLLSKHRLMVPWVGVVWFLLTIFVVLSMVRQSYDLKHLRDVLLIPVFIALGMTFAKGNIVRLFCGLQAVILAVMVFEALAPQTFAQIVKPWDYYVQTRSVLDYTESWHPESGLYISAFRPEGRFMFEWLGIHRLSSVFLEPVSLGNWCIVVTILVTAFWRLMSVRTLTFLILSNIILLIGSDGRLALAAGAIIVLLSIFAHRLPRFTYLAYLPAAILMAIVLAAFSATDIYADDFPGRIARTASFMTNMDIGWILGFDHSRIGRTADSGISYLILTQSLFGVVVLWAAICFLQPPTSRHAIVLMHGICVYVSLLLMVSFSLFSIKIAAPLWFLYGYVRARGYLECRTMCPAGPQAAISA
jgi:putative polymerase